MRVTLLQSIFLSRRRMINALCRVSVTFFSPLLIYRTVKMGMQLPHIEMKAIVREQHETFVCEE